MRPAGLHHADFRFREVVNHAHQPVSGRHEIGVENGDEFAFGDGQSVGKRPGLESLTVRPVDVSDVVAKGGVASDDAGSHFLGLVGRVVEDLDFELFAWILHAADSLNEAIYDELLIKNWELDSDVWKLVEEARRIGIVILTKLVIAVTEGVAVDAVDRKHDHYRKVGNQH